MGKVHWSMQSILSLAACLPESCQTAGLSEFWQCCPGGGCCIQSSVCIDPGRTAEVLCSEFAAQVLSWLFRVLSTQKLPRHLTPQIQVRSWDLEMEKHLAEEVVNCQNQKRKPGVCDSKACVSATSQPTLQPCWAWTLGQILCLRSWRLSCAEAGCV